MQPTHILRAEQRFEKPLPELFEFFSNASNLESITPASLEFFIRTPKPIVMSRGTRIDYRLALFGLPVNWRTVISEWEPPYRFVDEQESGPFALWRHEHTFEEAGDSVIMRDKVEYREPLGWLGALAHHVLVERLLTHVFAHRAQTLAQLMKA